MDVTGEKFVRYEFKAGTGILIPSKEDLGVIGAVSVDSDERILADTLEGLLKIDDIHVSRVFKTTGTYDHAERAVTEKMELIYGLGTMRDAIRREELLQMRRTILRMIRK